ncbi:hypothetical protein [Sphingopyxis macrogoltabida]|nr:hypothetical protein [Sphingopyxis macrogoltabida]
MADAEDVANSLSVAQAALIVWLNGEEFRDWHQKDAPGNRSTRIRLTKFTEAGGWPWFRRLTPFGSEVREALLRNPDA